MSDPSNPTEPGAASGQDPERDPNLYGAFISYRHTDPDRRWAKWLHSKIETYRVPERLVAAGAPRRVGRVFRDEEELPASSSLSDRIDEALTRSRFLLVVCSPRTPESRWVDEEVKRFQALGRVDRLLALLIEGEPHQSFPPALRESEPLAADVRPVEGERSRMIEKTALLKLLAGVLGVSYDDLRRREEERARRRLRRLATAGALLSLVFLGLSLFAWWQWQRAENELRISRAQNLAAQSQIAYVTTGTSEELETVDPERGVLLALESLNAKPTVAGDLALRAGLRKLEGPPLEIPIEDGVDLAGVGPEGRWILLQTEEGARIFDRATATARSATPSEKRVQVSAEPGSDSRDELGLSILARSPDGRLLLADSEDGLGGWVFASAAIHRSRDGKRLALLPHEWFLQHAAFGADSRWLVTVTHEASIDASDPSATALVGSTVRVWEAPSGRKATEVSLAHEGGIQQVAQSPDGSWLATQSRTPTGSVVLLWPLWPELLRAEACRRLTRNLSESEWETFVPFEPQRATCHGLPLVSE